MSRGSHTHLSLCIKTVYDNSSKGNPLLPSDEILHHNVLILFGSCLIEGIFDDLKLKTKIALWFV